MDILKGVVNSCLEAIDYGAERDWEAPLRELQSALQPQKDEEFFVSFTVDEPDQISAFFKQYGFVVVRDCLPPEQCDATFEKVFWQQFANWGLRRDDPDTWEGFWQHQQLGHLGIIGTWAEFDLPQLENRVHPNIHKAYTAVFGTEKLWVDHDRIGVMRPTKQVHFPSTGETVDVPEWKTMDRWLHMDCNPPTGQYDIAGYQDHPPININFYETMFCQSLMALTDARVQDGGFHCVPCAFKFPEIYKGIYARGGNIQVPQDHPIRKYVFKIPVRKGSIVIWNSLTFHANFPNDSSNFRVVQYFRMIPANDPKRPYTPLVDEKYMNKTKQEWVAGLTPTQRKLLGFDPWEK